MNKKNIYLIVGVVSVIIAGTILAIMLRPPSFNDGYINSQTENEQMDEEYIDLFPPQQVEEVPNGTPEADIYMQNQSRKVMSEIYTFLDDLSSFNSNIENPVEPTEDDRAVVLSKDAMNVINSGLLDNYLDAYDYVYSYIGICDSYYGGYYDKNDFIQLTQEMESYIIGFCEKYSLEIVEVYYEGIRQEYIGNDLISDNRLGGVNKMIAIAILIVFVAVILVIMYNKKVKK